VALDGDPPNPISAPSGCRFRTRRAFAMDRCAEIARSHVEVATPAHTVACHLSE